MQFTFAWSNYMKDCLRTPSTIASVNIWLRYPFPVHPHLFPNQQRHFLREHSSAQLREGTVVIGYCSWWRWYCRRSCRYGSQRMMGYGRCDGSLTAVGRKDAQICRLRPELEDDWSCSNECWKHIVIYRARLLRSLSWNTYFRRLAKPEWILSEHFWFFLLQRRTK